MVTRNVVLTEQQDEFVQGLVRTGRFQNASEALRAGLRLLEQEEAELEDLKAGIAEGLRQARNGEFAEGTGEEAINRVLERVLSRKAR